VEDEKIVDLFWERSESAIIETEKKYGQYCKTIAINILGNSEDAKECENDAYHALWNTIPPNRPSVLKAYLGRILRNIAIDKYDYNTAQKRNSKFDLILSELEECIVSPANVELQYEQGEIAKRISEFLWTIDKENRIVFVRRYWYSDSIASIAAQFGMSESKVKSMLFRMRNRLKIYLEKEGV
jgi:RNA polymerase sigma factor (sigma-70 family)